MRFVTFLKSGTQEKLGILHGSSVIDVEIAANELHIDVGIPDILHVIKNQSTSMPKLQKILEAVQAGKADGSLLPLTKAQLISPVPHPVSMRDGYAFRQHVEAARRNRGLPMIEEFDHFPIYYYTNHLAVTGPGEIAVEKQVLDKCDFELEVAVVIGKEGKNIPASKADEHIFGYMIMNDWSARTLQMEEMKLNLGPAKGKDFATSLGPVLVTRDELAKLAIPSAKGERHNLRMKAFVNGKQVSDGNMKDISWTFAQIIERVSYGVKIQPGEVIGSGTVGTGCFLELNGSKITDNQWLKSGDEVILEVDELGKLVNTIAEAQS
jgi:fumarylacetoacetate (FAA) hydrolase